MRFLLDENADARLVPYLAALGHDVAQIGTEYPASFTDEQVLTIAQTETRILITNDRDFGELIFRLRQPHTGVILFRLGAYTELTMKISRLGHVLERFSTQLDQFLVVEPHRVRVRRPRSSQD